MQVFKPIVPYLSLFPFGSILPKRPKHLDRIKRTGYPLSKSAFRGIVLLYNQVYGIHIRLLEIGKIRRSRDPSRAPHLYGCWYHLWIPPNTSLPERYDSVLSVLMLGLVSGYYHLEIIKLISILNEYDVCLNLLVV